MALNSNTSLCSTTIPSFQSNIKMGLKSDKSVYYHQIQSKDYGIRVARPTLLGLPALNHGVQGPSL